MAGSVWTERTLGVIGAGNMAMAIVRGVIQHGLMAPDRIRAADPAPQRRDLFADLGCQVFEQNVDAANGSESVS